MTGFNLLLIVAFGFMARRIARAMRQERDRIRWEQFTRENNRTGARPPVVVRMRA